MKREEVLSKGYDSSIMIFKIKYLNSYMVINIILKNVLFDKLVFVLEMPDQ